MYPVISSQKMARVAVTAHFFGQGCREEGIQLRRRDLPSSQEWREGWRKEESILAVLSTVVFFVCVAGQGFASTYIT